MTRPGSFRARLLAELQRGPLTLRQVYALAGGKRGAISRLSEMRANGEIVDLISLTKSEK